MVVPHRYDLQIEPDFENFTFRGRVEIEVEVTEPLTEIVLNAVDLEITDATLVVEGWDDPPGWRGQLSDRAAAGHHRPGGDRSGRRRGAGDGVHRRPE